MTPEEQKSYNNMSRTEKITFTVRRKMAIAEAKGQKNPCMPKTNPKLTVSQKQRNADRVKKLKEREAAVSVKEGDALDIRKMQGRMREMIDRHGVDPLEEIFLMLKKKGKGRLNDDKKAQLCKFLVPYVTPTLKAVDIQQETKMNVTVSVQSFKGASQEELRNRHNEVAKSEYEGFIDGDDNDGLVVDLEEVVEND